MKKKSHVKRKRARTVRTLILRNEVTGAEMKVVLKFFNDGYYAVNDIKTKDPSAVIRLLADQVVYLFEKGG